ncbi:hypothetical protein ACFE6N_18930 [Pedobacter sp. BG31]|uniref:hypothetical protein n=1 Tax=Pedobacter sp. BG31 TaxID=3349697 RepID=UPI0035F43AF2
MSNQVAGRIVCSNNGVPYIDTINYYYDGEKIISRSVEEKKISALRKKNLWYKAHINNTLQLAKWIT